jgi:hypothetical protein
MKLTWERPTVNRENASKQKAFFIWPHYSRLNRSTFDLPERLLCWYNPQVFLGRHD